MHFNFKVTASRSDLRILKSCDLSRRGFRGDGYSQSIRSEDTEIRMFWVEVRHHRELQPVDPI